MILYAKWTMKSLPVAVTFNSNDALASGTMNYLFMTTGSTTALTPNAFVTSGYTFTGWVISSNGSVAFTDGASFTIGTSNVTLYAKWTITPLSTQRVVTFDKNDIGAEGEMPTQIISANGSATLTANTFTKTGWTFVGWAESPSGSVVYTNTQTYSIGTENVTLYAKWTPPGSYHLRDRGPAGG